MPRPPCLVEKFPKKRNPRYIPPDFWKFFQQTQGQNRVLLLAYLHLGARRSKLFRPCWDNVDFDDHQSALVPASGRAIVI